jgi:outer membrane protein assembly factor BamB
MSLPISAMGDITNTPQIAWHYNKDTPYVPSPLLYGNLLYFNKLNNGVLTVLNAKTGQPVLEATRLQGISNVYASPVGAADRVYFTSRDGTTVVLKHGPTLELLATNRIDDLVDASPAIVGNQLFLRGQKQLYCFEQQ